MSAEDSYKAQQQSQPSVSSQQQPQSHNSWVYVNGESELDHGQRRNLGNSALWDAFAREHHLASNTVHHLPASAREAVHVVSPVPSSALVATLPLFNSSYPIQNQTSVVGNVFLPHSASASSTQNSSLTFTPGILRRPLDQSHQPHVVEQIQAKLSTMINSNTAKQYQIHSDALMKQTEQNHHQELNYNMQSISAIITNNGTVNKTTNVSPLTSNASLYKIDQPSLCDVFLDRGSDVQYHIGNITLRELVMSYALTYVRCENKEKPTYCELIYDEIISGKPPGRFLKRDKKTRKWFETNKKETLARIGELLEESGLNIKMKLDKAKERKKFDLVQKKEHEEFISPPQDCLIMKLQEQEDEKRIARYIRKMRAKTTENEKKNANDIRKRQTENEEKNTNIVVSKPNCDEMKKAENVSWRQVEVAEENTDNLASQHNYDEENKAENVIRRQVEVAETNFNSFVSQPYQNKRARHDGENEEEFAKKETGIVASQSNHRNTFFDGTTVNVGSNTEIERFGIYYPHSHDVLNGRDKYAQYHLGNIFFRDIVKKDLIAYGTCKRREKKIFCEKVYEKIIYRNPPGRFLTWSVDEHMWIPISKEKALKKIGQALRDERKTRKVWKRNE